MRLLARCFECLSGTTAVGIERGAALEVVTEIETGGESVAVAVIETGEGTDMTGTAAGAATETGAATGTGTGTLVT